MSNLRVATSFIFVIESHLCIKVGEIFVVLYQPVDQNELCAILTSDGLFRHTNTGSMRYNSQSC